MDLLFKRYANPFLLMDEMLAQGKLLDFIIHLFKKNREDMQWEVWLHKIHNMEFEEYKNLLEEKSKSYAMTNKQVDDTKKKSRNILKRFKPKM